MIKQIVLTGWVLVTLAFSSDAYNNLIGKNESTLDKDRFQCHSHICATTEKYYFNNPLLDETVTKIETFGDEKGEIYRVSLHVAHLNKFRNDDIIEAFFNAIRHQGKSLHPNLEYGMEFISDKYGNKSILNIIDINRRTAYLKRLEKSYRHALESYSK
jgi:hypothetical protein